jgi:hypothetical protein
MDEPEVPKSGPFLAARVFGARGGLRWPICRLLASFARGPKVKEDFQKESTNCDESVAERCRGCDKRVQKKLAD